MTDESMKFELDIIWDRWKTFNGPYQDKSEIEKITRELRSKLGNLLTTVNNTFGDSSFITIDQIEKLTFKPVFLFYYLGCDIATGKIKNKEKNKYIEVISQEIDNVVFSISFTMVPGNFISKNRFSEMVNDLNEITKNTGNLLCELGYKKIKSKEGKKEKKNYKKPWLATLLNIIPIPMGLGYIYIGQVKIFLIILFAQLFSLIPMTWLGLAEFTPYLLGIIWIYSIINVFLKANSMKNNFNQNENVNFFENF